MKFLRYIFDFLSSNGLACVLLLFLLLLTFLGTLEQMNQGIYEVQQRYFESMVVTFPLFDTIPVPLPGGYLLLSLLFINLLCGGIVRARKGWKKTGVLLAHFGILVLLLGGFIEHQMSSSGHLTLFEGESSNVFESYHEWEIAVSEERDNGEVTEYVIPGDEFTGLDTEDNRSLHKEGWPFELVLSGYRPNADLFSATGNAPPDARVVDGEFLRSRPQEQAMETNIAGAYISVHEGNVEERREGILWGIPDYPAFTFETTDGATWAIELRKKQFQLPFTVRLDEFTRELHPRTDMPAGFSSDITKIQDGIEQEIHISMNEPLRDEGYTLYQASWGPSDAGPNDPLFSTFAVVRNPADQFPLYASIIITLGLAVHFTISLVNYLRAQNRRAQQS
ncbi:MAG: cytochrome c biogenesis protein ResB [Candidatus Hydrogenedentota bacterium]